MRFFKILHVNDIMNTANILNFKINKKYRKWLSYLVVKVSSDAESFTRKFVKILKTKTTDGAAIIGRTR